jgi:osomolarity two-component system response regulator SSK1
MEWGCMQALIDFDGWRKWKDFSSGAAKPTKGSTNANGFSPAKDASSKDAAAAIGKGPSPAANNKLQRRDKRLSSATAMHTIDSASGTSGSDGTGMDSGDGGITAGA